MCCIANQLELPTSDAASVIAATRATGILPCASETVYFTQADRDELASAFMEGMRTSASRIAAFERERFGKRGWAFRWFQGWRPSTKAEEIQSDAMEEALDVVDRYYAPILARGMGHDEDMGILQSKGRGKTEGVGIKRDAYGTMLLVSVYCTTGPTNFDATTGDTEFEPGSRSQVFHLAYDALPTMERLAGDIAAYPVVTAKANHLRAGMKGTWMSEGWTGQFDTRPRLHRPWDTLPGCPS